MNRFDEISALLQKGRPRELSTLVQEELADGTAANDILTKALIPGMSAVGERFKKNEIFVPEVLITARAMIAAKGNYRLRESIGTAHFENGELTMDGLSLAVFEEV